jgi:hypothetical protein
MSGRSQKVNTISTNAALVFPKLLGKSVQEGQIMYLQGILYEKVVLEKINPEEHSFRERQEQEFGNIKRSPWDQA